ncbi:peroxiredoxin [Leekyejoonella antrihumi]|uniref:peroxiredoxin n=1 Tax=Leekyejoonella antrihumi TaxID=1660198 RepID=UPI0016486D0A|nr:peroxiredoxin [Leekyejoonella antrihumi]
MNATAVRVGDAAPDLVLKDQFGQDTSLRETSGARAALLVFYPFAFSRICTEELTQINEHLDAFQNDSVQVLCVSCDPMFTLRAWSQAQGFGFPLLSDFWPHGRVSRAYGVFDDRSGMAARGTFLVDRAGAVRWRLVNGPGEARDFAVIRDEVSRRVE